MPKTIYGKRSVKLIIAFFLFLSAFFLIVLSGQRGGEKFFDNLALAIPILIAAVCGIASFFTGITGILKDKERSISVFISTSLGFLVLLYCLAEILFPH